MKVCQRCHKKFLSFILVSTVKPMQFSSFMGKEREMEKQQEETGDFFSLQNASLAFWFYQLFTFSENLPSQS